MTAPLPPLNPEAVRQLDSFIAKFSDPVAALARGLFYRMRARIPGAVIPVYDNYNALAIAFGPNERVGDLVLSLAVYPRWVTLCFTWGVRLDDTHRLLKGSGSRIRHVRLMTLEALDDPRIDALIGDALARADPPVDPSARQRLVIKSVSTRQRPRRP